MLREMYEQFVFSEAGEVERVTRGTSPFVKFAFKSVSCIMIAEFSEVSDISLESIDAKLTLGETELLSLTFIPVANRKTKNSTNPQYAEIYKIRFT